MPVHEIYIVGDKEVELTFNIETSEYRDFTLPKEDMHALVTQTFTEKESKNIIFDSLEEAKRYASQKTVQENSRIWVHPIITVTLSATSLTFSRELESSPYTIISIDSAMLPLSPLGMLDEVSDLKPQQKSEYTALLQKNPDYKIACIHTLTEYEKRQWWKFWEATPSPKIAELKANVAHSTLFHLEKHLEDIQIHLENMKQGVMPAMYHLDFYGLLTAMRTILNCEKHQMDELTNLLTLIAFFPKALTPTIFEYLGASKDRSIAFSKDATSSSTADANRRLIGSLCDDGRTIIFKKPTPPDAKRSNEEELKVRGLSLFQPSSSATMLVPAIKAIHFSRK